MKTKQSRKIMHRYLSSSIISIFFYLFIGSLFFYLFSVNKYNTQDIKIVKIERVCLSTITQKSEPIHEEEKINEPAPKPIKERPKPIKKETIAKSTSNLEPSTQAVAEPIQESTKHETKEAVAAEKSTVSSTTNNVPSIDISEAKRDLFIADLIQRINNNKSYPNSARRRSIEGKVEVEFTVLADGGVENIDIISGQSIFAESTKEAIKNSFPVKIDKGLFTFPKKFKIDIMYILK
jgi:protein TonB